jgi:predicted ribosomally synthesized peptide with nif11-like leader
VTRSGLQAALDFVGAARMDEDLQRRLEELGDDVSPEQLVGVAEAAGYRFTPEELRRAHATDWRMRWVRFHAT